MKIFSLLDIQYKNFVNKVNTYLSSVLSKFNTQFGSNTVFGQILTVVGNAMQNIMLYIEDALVEQNKYTAQRKKSIYGLAALTGYEPSFGNATSVALKFVFTPVNVTSYNVIINNMEPLTCTQNGLQYNIVLSQEAIVLNAEKDNTIKYLSAVQGRFESQSFISTGGQYYTIPFSFLGNIDTNYIKVEVNNEEWKYAASLYDMSSDGKEFTYKASINGGIDLIFGNEAHGRALKANDIVKVTYLIHDGENGNLDPNVETYFVFENTLKDVNGMEHDGNAIFNVTFAETDPVISGSSSESTAHVREMIGYNTRSLVLASANNYKAFLNKFGFCGYNRTWSDANSMIVNSLIIKNYATDVKHGADYFNLKESDFILSNTQKRAIYDCIETSGHQMAGVKYQIFDPELCKYAMYIYVSLKSKKYDQAYVLNAIKQNIGEFFTNIQSDIFIPKSDIVHLLKNNIEGIDGVDIYILSQKNEEAIRTGKYAVYEYKLNSLNQYVKEAKYIKLYPGENPNLGLDSHGNIWLEDDTRFPVLMGGWEYTNDAGDSVMVTDPLTIIFEN